MMSPTDLERLQSARTALVLQYPFFGVLALRLEFVEESRLPTMATDGARIAFNADFVATLSQRELLGVLAHEVMHCAAGHPWRRDGREPRRWNVACDLAINPVLFESGLTLPAGALFLPEYQGKWAEWIYDRFPPSMTLTGGFAGGGDEVRDGDGDGQADAAVAEAEWQQAVKQVAAAEQARGTLPGTIARLLGVLGKPAVDWRAVLRRFVQEAARSDYNWTRPNPRFLAGGLYLPGLQAVTSMGPIAVAIDTSGSIDGPLLTQFGAEVTAIVEDVQPARTHVVYCDAAIQHEDVFERGEAVTLKAKGGGGTAFEPVMDWLGDLDEPPVCLVYLTDLYGSFGTAPEVPVLWATPTRGMSVPYGELVEIA